jgi:hypothetical protein
MFAPAYFAPRYFAPRYFGPSAEIDESESTSTGYFAPGYFAPGYFAPRYFGPGIAGEDAPGSTGPGYFPPVYFAPVYYAPRYWAPGSGTVEPEEVNDGRFNRRRYPPAERAKKARIESGVRKAEPVSTLAVSPDISGISGIPDIPDFREAPLDLGRLGLPDELLPPEETASGIVTMATASAIDGTVSYAERIELAKQARRRKNNALAILLILAASK